MRRLLVVRHCESTGQAAEAALSERGHEQAEALASWLARHPIDRVIASPYRRAIDSIAPFARASGLAVEVDEDLREHRLADPPIAEWREAVAHCFEDATFRAPGGESAAETLGRARRAIDAACANGARLPVLASHGQLLSLLLHSLGGRFGFAGWTGMTNPDVFLLEERGEAGFGWTRLYEDPSPPPRLE